MMQSSGPVLKGGWTLRKLVQSKYADYGAAVERRDEEDVLDRLSAEYEALCIALALAKRYGVPKGW